MSKKEYGNFTNGVSETDSTNGVSDGESNIPVCWGVACKGGKIGTECTKLGDRLASNSSELDDVGGVNLRLSASESTNESVVDSGIGPSINISRCEGVALGDSRLETECAECGVVVNGSATSGEVENTSDECFLSNKRNCKYEHRFRDDEC